MDQSSQSYQHITSKLPPAISDNLDVAIHKARDIYDAIIVLDDDPTGTQTVYDIPVLTSWDKSTIKAELLLGSPIFYILTNSRSMVSEDAEKLATNIGRSVYDLSQSLSKKCLLVSRGDSTLRGHYPAEVIALDKGLQLMQSIHFIVPAFFEGGRYTIDDVHYVRSGDEMIPAAKTPFAQDKVFGFKSSNLKDWVQEKSNGKVTSDKVESITLDDLRSQTMDYLISKLSKLQGGDVCIVNAVDYSDLKKFALAVLILNKPVLFRTAASFVAALAAQPKKELLNGHSLNANKQAGGLIVVGSYVPTSTKQLSHLREYTDSKVIELDVESLLDGNLPDSSEISREVDNHIRNGHNVVLCTSRKLISANSAKADLGIGTKVSDYLCDIVSGISVEPKFILAKGGITSSDIATKALNIKRAIVQGQIIPGVPVWQVGQEGKFKGLSYIIFPGNVGQENSLTEVVQKLATNTNNLT